MTMTEPARQLTEEEVKETRVASQMLRQLTEEEVEETRVASQMLKLVS